jgi:hypothetical protein
MSGEWDGAWSIEVDGLEARLSELEKAISRARAEQVEILARLDVLQVDLSDGDRGMEDWVASRLDVSPETAHRLMTITHSPTRGSVSSWRRAGGGWIGRPCWSNWPPPTLLPISSPKPLPTIRWAGCGV